MAELDPIIQDLVLNAAEYIGELDAVIALIGEAASDEEKLAVATEIVTNALNDAAAAARDLADGFILAGGSEEDAAQAAMAAEAAYTALTNTVPELSRALVELAAAERLVDDWDAATITNGLMNIGEDMVIAGVRAEETAKKINDARAAFQNLGNQTGILSNKFFGTALSWGQALHWIVMGTLEIAATALPALVALGAGLLALEQPFAHIYDRMNGLYVASGSMTAALMNGVKPLQSLAEAGYKLQQAVAPDAYIIFGSVINAVTGHVGAFSGVAQQAAGVLAQFATKLQTELAGPLGSELSGFFQNSIKYMIQWGQFLGNMGHTFVNVMNSMWGVGQLLLDVLNLISRALLDITSSPFGAWMIGTLAAMSALYRYSVLLGAIWKWLGGSALVDLIKALFGYMAVLGELATEETVAGAASIAFGDALDLAMGPAGIAIAVVTTALGLWYLSSRHAATATDNLISSINKMPPTVTNLGLGMQMMEGNVESLYGSLIKLPPTISEAQTTGGRFSGSLSRVVTPAVSQMGSEIQKSLTEMGKLANETIDLVTGLTEAGQRAGQVGAGMNAMAISTALSDSKIQTLNQALDQYVGLLTGVTSANADFITSMSNIGSVSATTTNNLGTNTVQLSLNANQFAKALTNMGTVGAAAWQNFDQVLSGSMEPMMDNLRQLGVTGAVTGTQMTTAALDMASQLANYAGKNKVAQASILGFLAAQGLTFPTFQKAQEAMQKVGASQNQLNGIIAEGAIKFSNLSAMAKNAASAMNPMVAGAIDAAALKTSGFNGALAKLQTDMQDHKGPDTIAADIEMVNGKYKDAINLATQTGNSMSQGSAQASTAVGQASKQMQSSWDNAKLKALNLANQVQSGSGSIGSHSNSAASQVRGAMSTMANWFDAAKLHAGELQNTINGMHGKAITVTTTFATNYTTSGSPSIGAPAAGFGIPHHAAGTAAAARGWAIVGEQGPELVHLAGGERIWSAGQTAQMRGFASGTGESLIGTHVTVHVHGSISTSQGIVRDIQSGLNRRTIRNPTTNLTVNHRRA